MVLADETHLFGRERETVKVVFLSEEVVYL